MSMARRHRMVPPQPLLVLFLLLLSAAARPCLAQQGNSSSSSSSHSHSKTAGGFTPTTVIVLVVLISAFVVLTLFSIYINRCAPGRPPPRRPFRYTVDHLHHNQHATGAAQVQPPDHRGLDRDVVESFPTAVYGDVKARVAAGSGPLECAVCLAAFDDLDELRVLPACCHVFHPDCIDPWLAAAVTCPLCRADLTAPAPLADPPASTDDACCDVQEAVREEPGDDDDDEARLVAAAAAFTPESVMSFGATSRPHQYRRTQSAMDAPDRHTLRLPEHVMRELAAVRRHRRAASLAGYPDAAVERTPGSGGWLASLWRSVSWQRPGHATDAAAEEHGHGGGSKRVVPVPETPAGGRPGGSGSSPGAATDEKRKPDFDALNNQV